MIRFSSVMVLLLAALPSGVLAQETIASDEDFFADSPLILTVSRMSKPIHESPASVSIIDREMIAASGARELADLLRLAPGFVVGYNLGHAPAVSYHGLGQEFGRQMQVLIDGRSVFIPSFGGVPWSNLPLLIDDIERIEVIRGPNAVTYGANAFLATINIITRHAAEDIGGKVAITAGHNNQTDIEDLYLRVGGQHDDLDWRLSMGTIADSGYHDVNDSKSVGKINFRLDYTAPNNQFWTAQFGSSSSQLGRGNRVSPTNPERDEEAANSYLNLLWEGIRGGNTTTLRLTHTVQNVDDHFDPGPFDLEIGNVTIPGVTTYIDFDRKSERSDLELIQSDEISDSVRLVYGAGLRRDAVKSHYAFNDDRSHQVDSNRLFGGVEWRPGENWLLDIGTMYEDSSLTDTEYSHRASLIRHLGERHALRLVASTARRNPILYETEGKTEFIAVIPAPFSTTVNVPIRMGNEDVESEEIQAFELGLHSQWTEGIDSDVRLFDYTIEKMLDETTMTVNTGPPLNLDIDNVGSPVNEDSVDVQGVELAVGYSTTRQFRLSFGASLVKAESNDDDIEQSFPEFTGYWLAIFRPDDRQEISAAYYYMDEISWYDSRDDVPIARKFDMRYRYQVHDRLEFELVGQNLLEDTTDYNEDKVHERLLYFGISAGF